MAAQHYFAVLLGSLLIGFAAGMALLATGRAGGVNGMVRSVVRPDSADAAWQAIFLLGLVAGGALLTWLDPAGPPIGTVAPIELMVGAGLLVGFSARRVERREALQGSAHGGELGGEKARRAETDGSGDVGERVDSIRRQGITTVCSLGGSGKNLGATSIVST